MSVARTIRQSAVALALGTGLLGSAQAESVHVYRSYNINSNQTFDVTSGAGVVAEAGRYFEFVMGAYDKLVTFSLKSTNPENQTATYTLFEDLRTERSGEDTILERALNLTSTWSGDTGTQLIAPTTLTDVTKGQDPSISYLLMANKQYLLFVDPQNDNRLLGDGAAPVVTQVSAVPLPAAFWMFGSAILGFFGFANRRKV